MNEPLLFDTSIWIDFLNKKKSPGADLLEQSILNDRPIYLTPTILQEILQGIRDDSTYERIKDTLSYFNVLDLPQIQAAIGAADLYRALRKKGATIRKSNDCLIAYYALEFSITLVHNDADFDQIQQYTDLKVIR
ncbi:PIN domain nuclease [Parapedobacter sp. GCM10030251]|uniref:type II toxin-antitoxin system VapC family toxin n=1 Tax=Parapedobacter sp. GCM10030251 TaxID=3273419 RepID=UPI0036159637